MDAHEIGACHSWFLIMESVKLRKSTRSSEAASPDQLHAELIVLRFAKSYNRIRTSPVWNCTRINKSRCLPVCCGSYDLLETSSTRLALAFHGK